jgi:RNA polymerase sigma factor (sigma-70 family)
MFLDKYVTSVDSTSFEETNRILFGEYEKDPDNTNLVEEIVRVNMPLVFSVASKLGVSEYGSKYEYDDVIAEGIIALHKAALNYDAKKGKFSTYAFECIKWSLRKILRKNIVFSPYLIKLPQEQYKKVCSALRKIDGGEELTKDEESVISYAHKYVSDNVDPESFYPDKDVFFDMEKYVEEKRDKEISEHQKDWIDLLKPIIKQLKPREQEVVCSIFGIGREQKNLSEMSKKIGVSPERARQILWFAIRKIKKAMVAKGFLIQEMKEDESGWGWRISAYKKNEAI